MCAHYRSITKDILLFILGLKCIPDTWFLNSTTGNAILCSNIDLAYIGKKLKGLQKPWKHDKRLHSFHQASAFFLNFMHRKLSKSSTFKKVTGKTFFGSWEGSKKYRECSENVPRDQHLNSEPIFWSLWESSLNGSKATKTM